MWFTLSLWTGTKTMKLVRLIMPPFSRFLFRRIHLFQQRCFSSLFFVQTDSCHSLLNHISRTCDTQASCYCSRLNLGIKRTVFVDEAVAPKEYYVRGYWHYRTCMYYSCHFLQYQNLLVRATSRERNTSAVATTCATERSNG